MALDHMIKRAVVVTEGIHDTEFMIQNKSREFI